MSQIPLPPAKVAASNRPVLQSALSQRFCAKIKSSGRFIGGIPLRLREASGTFFKHLGRGDVKEERKIVLAKGLKPAMVRCSVHLLAVSATTSIAYFNLAGFFIGSEFQGLTGGVYQALDTLCLQVTAKLLVTVSGLNLPLAQVLICDRNC